MSEKGSNKMFTICITESFDTKVINDKGKSCRVGGVHQYALEDGGILVTIGYNFSTSWL